MDEALTLFALKTVLAFGGALAIGAAQGQALADPTRPPALLSKAPTASAPSPVPAGPVLQSVLISRQAGGRQVAVIDGETVRLGGTFRGAQLVRMSETEVELMRGRQRQVLKLFAAASPKAVPAAQR
jgi:MSHA biogenesis protein MshK